MKSELTIVRALRRLMGLISLMMLWACSSDEVVEAPASASEHEIPISVSASARFYDDSSETRGITRSTLWNPPVGYRLYEDLYSESYENIPDLSHSTIDLFMTHDNADGDASTLVNPLHTRLRHSPSATTTSEWKLSLPNVTIPESDTKLTENDVQGGNYYAYGFVPRDAADDATITMLPGHSSWADGAVLTIQGMKTVTADPCVIIGAKEGPDEDHDNGLRAGDFKFNLDTGKRTIKVNGEDKEVIKENYLYFLFDHLCSALSIGIKVDGGYNTLRTIKLKRLSLQTATEDGPMAEKADVEVELVANNTGTNPITSLTYTPIGGSGTGSSVYLSNDGLTLTTSYKSFLSHFLPITGVTKVVITCTYDVYDKKNNLVRKDCKATNTIRLSDIISYFPGVQRGWKYGINMTVMPTYLYVLSDPDLDNPTLVVN